jgi:hypothetical protein
MSQIIVRKVPRLGTVKLLRLTKDMSVANKDELIAYISRLEASEDDLVDRIMRFITDTCSVKVD